MRTPRVVFGLDNNQKIRFVIDGFAMYCRVRDIENIGSTTHRLAVTTALQSLGSGNHYLKRKGLTPNLGFGTNMHGHDVQVDLCDENTKI